MKKHRSRASRRRPPRKPTDPFDLMVKDFASYAVDVDPALVELDTAGLFTDPANVEDLDMSDAVLRSFIPDLLLRPGPGAVALLLVTSQLLDGPVGRAARLAAAGMVAEGIERPAWADELELEVTASNCVRVGDEAGIVSLTGADIHRGGRGHSVLLAVNHLDGDRAERVMVLPEPGLLPALLAEILASAPTEMIEEEISPSAFRRRAQKALDRPLKSRDDEDDEGEPDDAACALVLRAWLRRLAG